MPLAKALSDFNATIAQCDGLIASAHRTDVVGTPFFKPIEQQQITIAAFLNMFIAWETFVEATLLPLMIGEPTLNGGTPIRRVVPPTIDDAKDLVRGIQGYFDYSRHDFVQILVRRFFDQGYPYEPHIRAIFQELNELKTIRNACAHASGTAKAKLRGLAEHISGHPIADITVYAVLTMKDTRPGSLGTALETYKSKLLIAAQLIAMG